MIVEIQVIYKAQWGQVLRLNMNGQDYDMKWTDGDVWTCEVETSEKKLQYSFEVVCNGNVVRREWGEAHTLDIATRAKKVLVKDIWKDIPQNRKDYSALLQNTGCHHTVEKQCQLSSTYLRLLVSAPTVHTGEYLAFVSGEVVFGGWQKATRMKYLGDCTWSIDIKTPVSVEYKFVVVNKKGEILRWENGDNRVLEPSEQQTIIVSGLSLRETVNWRGAGTAIPVFSLRSNDSFGVGEFEDLKLLARWCVRTGQKIIQILPINDTTMTHTWQDSYPYNANSTFALHPMYIRLSSVGKLTKAQLKLGAELNALAEVDYEKTMEAKLSVLRSFFLKQKEALKKDESYRLFIEKNESWLTTYALFSALRDKFSTPDFSKWGEYSVFADIDVEKAEADNQEAVDFYRFIQYHLDKQLHETIEYCHSIGVALKGDVPIGISRTSVDAWEKPHLFIMNSSAGAPPDDFSVTGQNWGFPIYNWPEMEKDGFAWWKARFKKMAEYFDAYRIDHILGFFRIWEVPLDAVNALLGEFNPSLPYTADEIRAAGFGFDPFWDVAKDFSSDNVLWIEYRHEKGKYYPRITPFNTPWFQSLDWGRQEAFRRLHDDFYYRRHNDFWRGVAQQRLAMLVGSTSMLTCGEDLGMIPDCVPDVMASEQILSLEIERMPKDTHVEFAQLRSYPVLSVATTSTHDMNPIRAWWKENREQTQRYYNNVMQWWGEAPMEATGDICYNIVCRHMETPSMLAILPLQDWMSIDEGIRKADGDSERINIPANSRHYWRYRMHITLENLLEADSFNDKVHEMVVRTGR